MLDINAQVSHHRNKEKMYFLYILILIKIQLQKYNFFLIQQIFSHLCKTFFFIMPEPQ